MRVSVLDLAGRLVYYPYMASIVGKKRGNQTYYYLVESARVDGKPRIVAQEYLGSAQEVMDRLSGAPAGRPAGAPESRSITSWALPRYSCATMRGLPSTRADSTR